MQFALCLCCGCNSGGENDNGFSSIGDNGLVKVEVDGGEVGDGIAGGEGGFGLDAITNKTVREGFVDVAVGKENVFKFKLHVALVVDPVQVDGMRGAGEFESGEVEFVGINRI